MFLLEASRHTASVFFFFVRLFVSLFQKMKKKELSSLVHFLLSSAWFSEIALCFRGLLVWPEKLEMGKYLHVKAIIHFWQKENFFREICGKVTKVAQIKKVNQREKLLSHPQPHSNGGFYPCFELMTPTLRQILH